MEWLNNYFSEENVEARMIKKENRRALKKEKKVRKARLRRKNKNKA